MVYNREGAPVTSNRPVPERPIMKEKSNAVPIVETEAMVEDMIRFHQNRYRYRGQPGEEYGVVFSVFQELNRTPQPSNQHILWYMAIIALVDHHRSHHADTPIAHPLDPEPSVSLPCQWARINKTSFHRPPVPDEIDSLGTYLSQIARLGILVSTKMEIDHHHLHLKINHIDRLLGKLLAELQSLDLSSPDYDTPLLSIQNATDNVEKIARMISPTIRQKILGKTKPPVYTEIVTTRTDRIPAERIAALFNMDDFWNGLIP